MSPDVKPSMCRVCLSVGTSNKLMSLFEQLDSCQVFEHIMSVAAVAIASDDGLPACICATCLLDLQTALGFRSRCEASDRALRSWDERIKNDSQKIKREVLSCEEIPVEEFLESISDYEPDLHSKHYPDSSLTAKGVQCHECQVFFKSKCKLRVHWKKEHLQRRFVCPTCKRLFKTLFAFTKHKRSPVRSCRELLNNDAVHIEGEGKTRMFQCTKCDYRVNRWIHMRQHIVIHTPWDKPFRCDLCPCAYSQAGTLRQHKAASHGEIREIAECHVCGKVFPTRRNLYRHFVKHQDAKIRCQVCNILVKSKVSLKNHMKRHSGAKTYTCEQCAAAFFTSAELANHRRLQHTEKQLFKCELCEYRAPRKHRLLIHEAGHAGDVAFPCIKCGKFYETLHHLNVHLVKYHKPKKFRCPVCPAMFSSRKAAKRHVKEKHGYQVLEVQPVVDTSVSTKDRPNTDVGDSIS